MKTKTADLQGQALDWAVAKCEGPRANAYGDDVDEFIQYSRDWSEGGPIIEREKSQITPDEYHSMWCAFMTLEGTGFEYWGPTPLIAAMRCYVASRMGDEIDVPEELI